MIENNDLPSIQNLVDAGWELSEYFGSSIILASTVGRLEIIKYLLTVMSVKVVLSETDNINYALICASENGHIEVVKLLIYNTGADIDYNDYAAIKLAKRNGHVRVSHFLEFMVFSDRLDEILEELSREKKKRENGKYRTNRVCAAHAHIPRMIPSLKHMLTDIPILIPIKKPRITV